MRPYLIPIVAVIALSHAGGCQAIRDLHNKQAKAQDDYHDDYKIAGEEGRAELPREKETDGLTPWLESPEARAINKNLGID